MSSANHVNRCLLLQLSIEKAQAIAEQVELKAKVVQTEVKTITLRHKKALEERECELLWKVRGHSVYLTFEELENTIFGLDLRSYVITEFSVWSLTVNPVAVNNILLLIK